MASKLQFSLGSYKNNLFKTLVYCIVALQEEKNNIAEKLVVGDWNFWNKNTLSAAADEWLINHFGPIKVIIANYIHSNVKRNVILHSTLYLCMEGRECCCYTSAFGRWFDKSFHLAYCPSHWHTPCFASTTYYTVSMLTSIVIAYMPDELFSWIMHTSTMCTPGECVCVWGGACTNLEQQAIDVIQFKTLEEPASLPPPPASITYIVFLWLEWDVIKDLLR